MLKLRKGDIQYETLLSRLHEIVQRIESSQAGKAPLVDIFYLLGVSQL